MTSVLLLTERGHVLILEVGMTFQLGDLRTNTVRENYVLQAAIREIKELFGNGYQHRWKTMSCGCTDSHNLAYSRKYVKSLGTMYRLLKVLIRRPQKFCFRLPKLNGFLDDLNRQAFSNAFLPTLFDNIGRHFKINVIMV